MDIVKVQEEKEICYLLNISNEWFIPSLTLRDICLEEYAKKLCNNAMVYAVYDKDVISGFIVFYMNDIAGRQTYLTQLAVNPIFRKKGIASSLLNFMEAESKSKCFKEIKLEVSSGNEKAISLYLKFGYVICDMTEKSYYMKKEI